MRENKRKCSTCREGVQKQTSLDYTVEMEHDGRAYTISVNNLLVLVCDKCGAKVLPDSSQEQLENELRHQAGLLTPTEITANREKLNLSQKDFANLLGIAPATVSRWETGGQIQQRVMDRFLRAFFAVPPLRFYFQQLTGVGMRSHMAVNTTVIDSRALPEND